MSIKEMTKSKGPKLDWKVGLNTQTIITGVCIGIAAGMCSYMDQRISFCKGASVALNDNLEKVIHF